MPYSYLNLLSAHSLCDQTSISLLFRVCIMTGRVFDSLSCNVPCSPCLVTTVLQHVGSFWTQHKDILHLNILKHEPGTPYSRHSHNNLPPFCLPPLTPYPILLAQGRGQGEQPGDGYTTSCNMSQWQILYGPITLHTVNEIWFLVTVRNKVRGRVMWTVV